MLLKPAWRITKSLPSDADCNVHRVRLMWRQWRQQKRRVWTVAEPQGGSDQHIHTVQNPASPTGDISLPDTNAKIQGLSFGHTITHPRGSEHISADIDVSACWQEADYKRHRFSFWRELRRTALRKQLKFWITWAEVEQERAAAQARDNEQQSIMRLGSSQVMTDNEHNWHGITQWNQHWTATVPPQSRTTTGIFTGWFDYSRLFGLSLLW